MGRSRGRIPLSPPCRVFRLQLLEAGAEPGPFEPLAVPRHHVSPLGWKAVTAGEQGQAAGPGKLQVRGGFAFVQAIRKGALVAQRELKTSP